MIILPQPIHETMNYMAIVLYFNESFCRTPAKDKVDFDSIIYKR